MRADRAGFTVIELLVVMMLAGIIAGTTIPRLGQAMAQNRVQRAASVVAADLQLAHSMASRQRRPVRVAVTPNQQMIRVHDTGANTTIFSERRLGANTDYGIQRVTTTRTEVIVYPNGLVSSGVDITLRSSGYARVIRMTRAGHIRVTAP